MVNVQSGGAKFYANNGNCLSKCRINISFTRDRACEGMARIKT